MVAKEVARKSFEWSREFNDELAPSRIGWNLEDPSRVGNPLPTRSSRGFDIGPAFGHADASLVGARDALGGRIAARVGVGGQWVSAKYAPVLGDGNSERFIISGQGLEQAVAPGS